MRSFYKIVRGDYTDCWSGTIRYGVGTTVRHPNPAPPGTYDDPCGRRWLHACVKPHDTLQFHRSNWPLRLLRVTASDNDFRAEDYVKVASVAFAVEEELPLSLAFGPNGEAVVRFINDLPTWPWLRSDRTADVKVLNLADEHLRRLSRYGDVRTSNVRIEEMTLDDVTYVRRDITKGDAGNRLWRHIRMVAWSDGLAVASDEAWGIVWDVVWKVLPIRCENAAEGAGHDVAYRVVQHLMGDRPNPYEPLSEIWRLGFYPIGPIDGTFVIAAITQ